MALSCIIYIAIFTLIPFVSDGSSDLTRSVKIELVLDPGQQNHDFAAILNDSIHWMKQYLDNRPDFVGKNFSVEQPILVGSAVQMKVIYKDGDLTRKDLAYALNPLHGLTLSYDNTNYMILFPRLECSFSMNLEPAACCLCESNQTCNEISRQRNMWICRETFNLFYPYGFGKGDATVPPDDEFASEKIKLQFHIPFGKNLVDTVYISANGLISFGEKFTSYVPEPCPIFNSSNEEMMILAPYWTDLNIRSFDVGQVFSQVYTKTASSSADVDVQAVLARASEDVMLYSSEKNFSATLVIVVTWSNLTFWPAEKNNYNRVNFQCVVISNGQRTFAIYNYGFGTMIYSQRKVEICVGSSNLHKYRGDLNNLGLTGNTGIPRYWFFQLGHAQNSEAKCFDWYQANIPQLSNLSQMNQIIPPCPCSEKLAAMSILWLRSSIQQNCYDILPIFGQSGRRCCYRWDGNFENRIPEAGSFQHFTPHFGDHKSYKQNEVDPKRWCCEESDLCHLFYRARPTRACDANQRTARGIIFGDPHIRTLDNQTYSFNGLGEYTLLEIEGTSPDNFILQGRTCRIRTSGGNLSEATVLCAIAVKNAKSEFLTVEISTSGKYMIVFANEYDITKKLHDSQSIIINSSNFVLEKVRDLIKVSTPEEIGFIVRLNNNQLVLSVEVGIQHRGKAKGLLAVSNFNGNSAGDFMFPNGTYMPSNGVSDQMLFEFGQTWSVTDSNFRYTPGQDSSSYTDSNFVPKFLNAISHTDIADAQIICGNGNVFPCIYDYAITRNDQFALSTRETILTFEKEEELAANHILVISGTTQMNITVNQTSSNQTLTVRNPDNDYFSFVSFFNGNGLYLIINSSDIFVFEYTPFDIGPVLIEVAAVDSKGQQSEVQKINVTACSGCNNHGTCNFDEIREVISPYFSVASCNCDEPFSGDDCENDKNGCDNRPCPYGTNCTDVPASEESLTKLAYTCSACPAGFKLDVNSSKCEDIDECASAVYPCDPNAYCTNTYGSYSCACSWAFRTNPTGACVGINLCVETQIYCEQICSDLWHNISCTCEEGFESDNFYYCTKLANKDPCQNLAHKNCSYGCRNASGTAQCFCKNGMQLAADGYSCEDIDECQENLCSQGCRNTLGSFSCFCYDGYSLGWDGRTCEDCPDNHYGDCFSVCACRGRAIHCDSVKGCVCDKGWTGQHCEVDVDECQVNPNLCPPDQTCTNTDGSYTCTCLDGYTDTYGNGNCVNINECEDSSVHMCPQQCIDLPGSYDCVCSDGYILINNTCQDINECDLGRSGCDQDCTNLESSFNCGCYAGFSLADDRKSCIQDQDPCQHLNLGCEHYCEIANSSPHSPHCSCKRGYQLASNGINCTDIDECVTGSHKCMRTCVNTVGSYNCSCDVGMQLSNDLISCQACDKNKWGPMCAYNCACSPMGTQTCDPVSGCVCKPGWTGTYCSDDVDECKQSQLVCPSSNCTNTNGSYICHCQLGFQLDQGGNCTDINECSLLDPCDHHCTNTEGGYICSCFKGFWSEGHKCKDIDECMSSDVNKCDQLCRNTAGGFACECFTGYVLNTTDRKTCYACDRSKWGPSCIYDCNCNPMGTRTCDPASGCVCKPGWTGFTCYDETDECKQNQTACPSSNCTNMNGSHICYCEEGFQLDQENCIDIDECANPSLNNCSHPRRCTNTNGSFECGCSIGYIEWNGHCVDIDECSKNSHNCSLQRICYNTDGSIMSICYNTGGNFVCSYQEVGDLCTDSLAGYQLHLTLIYTDDQIDMDIFDNRTEAFRKLANEVANSVAIEVIISLNYGLARWKLNLFGVKVIDFSQGSVIANIIVYLNKSDSVSRVENIAKFVHHLNTEKQLIINGTVVIVENIRTEFGSLPPSASLCDVFNSFMSCPSGQICEEDSVSCRPAHASTDSFYPYGEANGDHMLLPDLENATERIHFQYSIPYGHDLVDDMWISVNGLISFKKRFASFSPQRLPIPSHSAILAVYWTDLDLSSLDTAHVFYKHYVNSFNNTKDEIKVFEQAKSDIAQMYPQESGDFNATHVVVVTWDGIAPWPVQNSSDERVTFQCAVISNGELTFAIYRYGERAMNFNPDLERIVEVGWGSTNLDISRRNYYAFDSIIGNTNKTGFWVFKIGEIPASRRLCLDWYNQNRLLPIEKMNDEIPLCPCRKTGAMLSTFWIPSEEESDCFDSFPEPGPAGRRCCYAKNDSEAFENRIPLAGSFQMYTPYYGDLVLHDFQDTLPKQWCCVDSSLCHLYYEVRPAKDCAPRKTARSLFFGDPHIRTLDNRTFIFNGLGEYKLLEIYDKLEDNTRVNFKLQGRTCHAKTNTGNLANATVFCALALKTTSGTTVHIERSQSGKEMAIYINGTDNTIQMRSDFKTSIGGVLVQKVNNSLKITTPDDIGMNVTINEDMIDFSIELNLKYKNWTKGLVGNFNGDPNDDFIYPNGTQFKGDATERNLFHYAQTWAVNQDSVFVYLNGLTTSNFSKPDFLPYFLDENDSAQDSDKKIAEEICGASTGPCVYDLMASNSSIFALITRNTDAFFKEMVSCDSNRPPVIQTPPVLNIIVNKQVTLTLTAKDPDGDDLIFNIVKTSPMNSEIISYTFDYTSITINYTSNGIDQGQFGISAVQKKCHVTVVQWITIVSCSGCSNHGTCNFNEYNFKFPPYYSEAKCDCEDSWTGINCEAEKDWCKDLPCPSLTKCHNVRAADRITVGAPFICTDCPAGLNLSADGKKCEDINECVNGSALCENAECINTIGSFICACLPGFRKNNSNICVDINECTDNQHNCSQICINKFGSFDCRCKKGFSLDNEIKTKCVKSGIDPCENKINCSYGCNIVDGVARCFCQTGRMVAADGFSCEDINECATRNPCSQQCNNTDGSFFCSCFTGFKLAEDHITCERCPESFYGHECKEKCQCRGNAESCDHIKGCICKKEWTGQYCEDKVDQCAPNREVQACGIYQQCRNSFESYKCTCLPGYKDDNGSCSDIDECAHSSLNNCQELICINNIGSYTCVSKNGFRYNENTESYEDIDECALETSGCEQICKNMPGGFNCLCHHDFILTDDRKTCIKKDDPCKGFDVNCQYACNLMDGKPQCYCKIGFQLGIDGASCIDKNECQLRTAQCTDTCENTIGSYSCSCPSGKHLLKDGRTCKECDINYWGPDCSNECACHPLNTLGCDPSFGCECTDGWTGLHCDQDKDECSYTPSPCTRSHWCHNSFGSYTCGCNEGFYLDSNGACKDIDECIVSKPCEYFCTNTNGSYTCSCPSNGFRRDGNLCLDIDECAIPALNDCDQLCRNTAGSFACECYQGFTLDMTTRNTCYDEYKNHTCSQNSTCRGNCRIENGEEICYCSPGYSLTLNDSVKLCQDIDECKMDYPCKNGSCSNTEGQFNCSCYDGFTLSEDRVTCQVCDFGFHGPNCSRKCMCAVEHTKHCSALDGHCTCYPGWTGTNCSDDVDECSGPEAFVCGNNSHCENTQGSFRCICARGFSRSSDEECLPCDASHYGQDCLHSCTCNRTNTVDCNDETSKCVCRPGWTGDSCDTDVNECEEDANYCTGTNLTCYNTIGSAECRCNSGYERFEVKGECKDINECLDPKFITCSDYKKCMNTDGGFQCFIDEYRENVKNISYNKELAIGLGVGIPLFVILVAALILIIICRRWKSRREKPESPTSVDGSLLAGATNARKFSNTSDIYKPYYSPVSFMDSESIQQVGFSDTGSFLPIDFSDVGSIEVDDKLAEPIPPVDYSDSGSLHSVPESHLSIDYSITNSELNANNIVEPTMRNKEHDEIIKSEGQHESKPEVRESAELYFWNNMFTMMEPHKDLHIQRPHLKD